MTNISLLILTNPCHHLCNCLRLNCSTSSVDNTILSDQIACMISSWHFKNWLSSCRRLWTSRSQRRCDLTGSPWIIRTGNENEASRVGETVPSPSVLIRGVVSGSIVQAISETILLWKPLTALAGPVWVLHCSRNDCGHSSWSSVLPPRNVTPRMFTMD
jgi:hypothetical protein